MPVRPPTYRPQGQRTRQEARAERDSRRGTAQQRGYDSRWEKAAAAYKRDHPCCTGCRAVGKVEKTAVVDHILPHKGNPHLMWNVRNWQPACRFHHDVVKQRLEKLFDRGKIQPIDLKLDSLIAIRLTRELSWDEPSPRPGGASNL